MGSIKIQDMGYIKNDNSGSRASTSNIANGGSAITLKTAEFTPALKRNISDQPNLATNTTADIKLGSLENMKFLLNCILNTNIDSDMALIQHLLNMVRTYGYKTMWYDYSDASNEKNNGQLIYQIALNSIFGRQFSATEISTFSISSQYYRLAVHFFDIQPKHSGKTGFINYSMQGVVLPVLADTL